MLHYLCSCEAVVHMFIYVIYQTCHQQWISLCASCIWQSTVTVSVMKWSILPFTFNNFFWPSITCVDAVLKHSDLNSTKSAKICSCSSPTLGGVHRLGNEAPYQETRTKTQKVQINPSLMFPCSQQREHAHDHLLNFNLFPIISKNMFLTLLALWETNIFSYM